MEVLKQRKGLRESRPPLKPILPWGFKGRCEEAVEPQRSAKETQCPCSAQICAHTGSFVPRSLPLALEGTRTFSGLDSNSSAPASQRKRALWDWRGGARWLADAGP